MQRRMEGLQRRMDCALSNTEMERSAMAEIIVSTLCAAALMVLERVLRED